MIEIDTWRFGGHWIIINEDNRREIAEYVLEQLFAQMMGWA